MEGSNQGQKIFATKDWFLFPLTYLLIAACLGVFLRVLQLHSLSVNFLYILHTHSHIALLGWAHMGFFLLLVNGFVPYSDKKKKKYYLLFWAFQLTIIGMLLFFPFQGYSLTTITFSSLFLVVSYFFAYWFFKDTGEKRTANRNNSKRFARTSVFFLILASLGPWLLGPLNANGLGGSDIYFNAIYFYLHFLYNGWFLFALLALLFLYLEREGLLGPKTKLGARIHLFFSVSTLLAYALSTFWVTPPIWVYLLGALSVFIQLVGVLLFLKLFFKIKQEISFLTRLDRNIAFGITIAFLLKVILQSFSSIPVFATQIAETRSWVIAYLHLVFLGIVSPSILLGFFSSFSFNKVNNSLLFGWFIFAIGFLGHEAIMLIKGIDYAFIKNLNEMLLCVTSLLPIGIFFIWLNFLRNK